MSHWRLLKTESFTLPRAKALELAAKHAGMPRSPVERRLEPNRVKRLAQIIREGRTLPFNWATVLYDGHVLRMNGQHSSVAIGEVGAEIPGELTFHLDHFEAKDRAGMVELFRQFDQRWSSRSALDIAGAFQGLMPDIADCDRGLMKLAAEAVSWCLRTVEGADNVPTGDDTYDLLHVQQHVPFYRWFNGITNGRRELMRKEVAAAMYKTFDASQSGASEFWREVSFGPDYFADDHAPGAVLIDELSKAVMDKDFRANEFETAAIYYKKAVKAWNAFCAGKQIDSLKVTKGKGWPDVSRYGDKEEAA